MWKEKDRAMKSTNFYINWRKLAAFTMAICLLLVFSACGSSPQPSEELPTPSAAKELPMPEGTGAAGGQELTINMPENPQTLNPLTAQEENLCNVLSLVVEPAIKIEANGEILPSVIENWTFDAQTMTFTFVIRKNVSFHDGKGTVGADDLLFCIERICSYTEAESPYAKYKYVVGGYAKIDDTTFTVKVTEKTKDIFYFMNFPVLPKSYYESAGVDFLQKPVGTGPYQVDSYTKGEGMALSLFGDWWKTPPVFTKITAKPMDAEDSKIKGYQDGSFDAVMSASYTAESYASEGKTTVHPIVYPTYHCLIPNMGDSFVGNKNVRRAISMALDRSKIVSASVLGSGQATETPLRQDLWYFENSSSAVGNGYNASAAGKLLEDAGYKLDAETGFRYSENGNGSKNYLKVNLIFTEAKDFAYRSAICESVADQLAVVGIQVNIIEKSDEDYKTALSQHNFDLALCSYSMKSNQEIDFLFSAENNYGGYNSGALQEQLGAAHSALTEEELQTAYTALQKSLLEDMPNIGLFYGEHSLIMRSDISIGKPLGYKNIFANINEWK